jgi:hypothetical protein
MFSLAGRSVDFKETSDGNTKYYNADIINDEIVNQFNYNNNGLTAVIDPDIVFNETRATPILKNAADYVFSIVRFTMNGANRDLPLFIPSIQQGTGQTDVNATVYSMAVPASFTFTTATGNTTLQLNPPSRYISYYPETQNPILAPLPRSMANLNYKGVYNSSTLYRVGDIVSVFILGSLIPGFYQVKKQNPYNNNGVYPAGSLVFYDNSNWLATQSVPINTYPGQSPTFWTSSPVAGTLPGQNSQIWSLFSPDAGQPQDISTRYYWVYSYSHFVDMWNKTMYDPAADGDGVLAVSRCAYQDTYVALYNAFVTAFGAGYTFPYPTFGDFVSAVYPPQLYYDDSTHKFTIYADSNGFGQRLTTFTPTNFVAAPNVGVPTSPTFQLFFNTNMFGLIANLNNIYRNTPNLPDGYTNEILFTNRCFQNISDFRYPPYQNGAPPPLGYNPQLPTGGTDSPNMLNRVFWLARQDESSVDSLWSPIASIVFQSTLLPIATEDSAAPNVLGTSNTGDSTATVQPAFQPIITDIAVDTGDGDGAANYRKFIYYVPTAEYRISDFLNSKQDIHKIDIRVYWKNRLNNQLYPIQMFNLSSVSLKIMFRKKSLGSKTD